MEYLKLENFHDHEFQRFVEELNVNVLPLKKKKKFNLFFFAIIK